MAQATEPRSSTISSIRLSSPPKADNRGASPTNHNIEERTPEWPYVHGERGLLVRPKMTWASTALEVLIGKFHVIRPNCLHVWRLHLTNSPIRQRWYPFGPEKQNQPRDEATHSCAGCCGFLLDCIWALMLYALVVFEASTVRIFNATYSPSISVFWASQTAELPL